MKKTSTKVFVIIEVTLAALAVMAVCAAAVYIDEHPIKAFFDGFSVSDMIPLSIGGFVAASALNSVITGTIAAIKAAVEKKKAKKAAK